MADVTKPEAIKYVNEVVRPLAERVRGLKYQIDNAADVWFAGIDAIVGSDAADAIDDGRESQGVSRLTAADVTALLGRLSAIRETLDTDAEFEKVLKPCVRAYRSE